MTSDQPNGSQTKPLRYGWTTGACATAATKSALIALCTGKFEDPVTIELPKGQTPTFPLANEALGDGFATASIIKDAGDDPDVTHLANIIVTVRPLPPGDGIRFCAGEGVGTVTLPGLPIPVGEPAINPIPRKMIQSVITQTCHRFGQPADFEITIGVEGGKELAKHTWNPRLGIKGGLSILGTTGIVRPFSCSAWIASIHLGIDVARRNNIGHLLAATGSTSEAAACKLYSFGEQAIIDMGDFAGGVLKYLRKHPVDRLTIAGGFAKLTKLAHGAMDLHSGRSQVDFHWLADQVAILTDSGQFRPAIVRANTAYEVLELCNKNGIDIAGKVAEHAQIVAKKIAVASDMSLEILVVSRSGEILARYG